uniref:PH domain-containing protein n=1 Tax=Gouania willdenowi TaxID=441366 RepID=A0A8C5I7X7_GOUWI
MDTDSRLYFRKNYAKYEFFRKPLDFFPDHMLSISSESNGMVDHSDLIQTFLKPSTCPEIHGHLHSKDQSRKPWKKLYFVLRRSGLYFSNKGTSKEPRHLQFFADFNDSDIYWVFVGQKTARCTQLTLPSASRCHHSFFVFCMIYCDNLFKKKESTFKVFNCILCVTTHCSHQSAAQPGS